jgi:adenylate cyclase
MLDDVGSHFWLVLSVAAVNVALGLVASEAAARRDDARTFFVSMVLASAGFLGLHALATPGVLLEHQTAGFSVAARVGLVLAAGFAAISPSTPPRRWFTCWHGITGACARVSGWY